MVPHAGWCAIVLWTRWVQRTQRDCPSRACGTGCEFGSSVFHSEIARVLRWAMANVVRVWVPDRREGCETGGVNLPQAQGAGRGAVLLVRAMSGNAAIGVKAPRPFRTKRAPLPIARHIPTSDYLPTHVTAPRARCARSPATPAATPAS